MKKNKDSSKSFYLNIFKNCLKEIKKKKELFKKIFQFSYYLMKVYKNYEKFFKKCLFFQKINNIHNLFSKKSQKKSIFCQ